jgi:Tfp pilus assembly PilM family ATPase
MVSLDGGVGEADLAPEQLEAVREAMRSEIQALARELLASLQFYQSRPGSLAIGEVLLTGGGASLAGLTQELQERLRVPVRAVDPFENVHAGKKAKIAVDQGAAAIAIGLGMEG